KKLDNFLVVTQEDKILYDFIEDEDNESPKLGDLVRSRKGVELYYSGGEFVYSSPVTDKLSGPLIVNNVINNDLVVVAGKIKGGKIVEITVDPNLLHTY